MRRGGARGLEGMSEEGSGEASGWVSRCSLLLGLRRDAPPARGTIMWNHIASSSSTPPPSSPNVRSPPADAGKAVRRALPNRAHAARRVDRAGCCCVPSSTTAVVAASAAAADACPILCALPTLPAVLLLPCLTTGKHSTTHDLAHALGSCVSSHGGPVQLLARLLSWSLRVSFSLAPCL